MDTDFPRSSRYTHIYWMHSTLGAESGIWQKTPNSLQPHLLIIAELLTQAGQLIMESGVKYWERYRTVMLVLMEGSERKEICHMRSHDSTAFYRSSEYRMASRLGKLWQVINAPVS